MESPWQSTLAIVLAILCAGWVGWRVVRPFLPRRTARKPVPPTELLQIDPAPSVTPPNADSAEGKAL